MVDVTLALGDAGTSFRCGHCSSEYPGVPVVVTVGTAQGLVCVGCVSNAADQAWDAIGVVRDDLRLAAAKRRDEVRRELARDRVLEVLALSAPEPVLSGDLDACVPGVGRDLVHRVVAELVAEGVVVVQEEQRARGAVARLHSLAESCR